MSFSASRRITPLLGANLYDFLAIYAHLLVMLNIDKVGAYAFFERFLFCVCSVIWVSFCSCIIRDNKMQDANRFLFSFSFQVILANEFSRVNYKARIHNSLLTKVNSNDMFRVF